MQGQVKVVPARWWRDMALSRLIRDTRQIGRAERGCSVVPPVVTHAGADPVCVAGPGARRGRSAQLRRRERGRAVGLAQMRPLEEPRQWEVVFLAVELPQAGGRGRRRRGGRASALAVRPRPAESASPRRTVRFRRGAGCGTDRGAGRGGGRAVRAVQAGGLLARGAGVRATFPAGEAVGRLT